MKLIIKFFHWSHVLDILHSNGMTIDGTESDLNNFLAHLSVSFFV